MTDAEQLERLKVELAAFRAKQAARAAYMRKYRARVKARKEEE